MRIVQITLAELDGTLLEVGYLLVSGAVTIHEIDLDELFETEEQAKAELAVYFGEEPERPYPMIVTGGSIDPTPWCTACGASTQADCRCGPIAENE